MPQRLAHLEEVGEGKGRVMVGFVTYCKPKVCQAGVFLWYIKSLAMYFSVCSSFYMLLGWSGDSQAPYPGNQKPEVHLEYTLRAL